MVIANAAAALAANDAAQRAVRGEPVTGALLDRIRAFLPEARAAVVSGAAGNVMRRWIDTSQALRS